MYKQTKRNKTMAKSIFSAEHKKAISNGLKGKPRSEEAKARISEGVTKAWARRKAMKPS